MRHRTTRREFIGAGLAGTLGLAFSPAFQKPLAGEGVKARAKACILLWLEGGPSHLDTFDPKPGVETGGPFKAIDTTVPGLKISEHLPHLAKQAKHFTIVRSLTSREADHERAVYYLHTGNPRSETVEYPGLGAVVARSWSGQEGDLPSYVVLSGNGSGPGFFGLDYAPYTVGSLDDPISNLALPEGVDEARLNRRLKALEGLNGGFGRRVDPGSVAEQDRLSARALRLRKSPALKAFDLKEEKPEGLKAYGIKMKKEGEDEDGRANFNKGCLLASRLVEHGVRFVEVTLDGWDTHEDNFNQVSNLSGYLDRGFAALLADLKERGLLDRTLVICMGEFGRTPQINPAQGRDHHSEAFSVVLAGGGVRGGQVIGASDARGEHVKERPITVPDLYASLLAATGIDGGKTYRTPEGRPIKLADKGKVIAGLLG